MKLKFHLRLMENNLTIQIIKEISDINPNNKYIAEIKGYTKQIIGTHLDGTKFTSKKCKSKIMAIETMTKSEQETDTKVENISKLFKKKDKENMTTAIENITHHEKVLS